MRPVFRSSGESFRDPDLWIAGDPYDKRGPQFTLEKELTYSAALAIGAECLYNEAEPVDEATIADRIYSRFAERILSLLHPCLVDPNLTLSLTNYLEAELGRRLRHSRYIGHLSHALDTHRCLIITRATIHSIQSTRMVGHAHSRQACRTA